MCSGWAAEPSANTAPAEANLERTCKTLRMLDDLYKTAIVLITEHYVDEDSDLAAGEAFKALFATMREKGWHEVRLIDATGRPIAGEKSCRTSSMQGDRGPQVGQAVLRTSRKA